MGNTNVGHFCFCVMYLRDHVFILYFSNLKVKEWLLTQCWTIKAYAVVNVDEVTHSAREFVNLSWAFTLGLITTKDAVLPAE